MTYHRIALLHMAPGAETAAIADLENSLNNANDVVPGLLHSHLGRHAANTVGGGDYTWDMCFADRASCPPWPDQLAIGGHQDLVHRLTERVDAVSFQPTNVHVVEPEIRDFIKRTLFIEVDRTTPQHRVDEFGRVLTGMPRYIAAIRNWGYHRVDDELTFGPRQWTHVWEQEFQSLEGLRGDYMMSPYHWGYVDPWFDPESATRIVDRRLAHVFCPAASSILGWFG